jgi:hypothetical protein
VWNIRKGYHLPSFKLAKEELEKANASDEFNTEKQFKTDTKEFFRVSDC